MLAMRETIYNLIDLKLCYNRQLANLGSIIEESARRNSKVIQIFTKMIPVWERYICTDMVLVQIIMAAYV